VLCFMFYFIQRTLIAGRYCFCFVLMHLSLFILFNFCTGISAVKTIVAFLKYYFENHAVKLFDAVFIKQ
jgi:hypothetical protein